MLSQAFPLLTLGTSTPRIALLFLCESHLFDASPFLNISVIDSAEQNPRKISNLLSLYNVQQRTADL